MQRDLTTVLKRILSVVPSHELETRAKLNSLIGRLPYTAPELEPNMWHSAAALLGACIPNPIEAWQLEAARIFSGHDGTVQ